MTTASVLIAVFLGLLSQDLGSAELLEENCGVAPLLGSNNLHPNFGPRINNGRNATIGANPWMALLSIPAMDDQPPEFFCAGTLITECFVLTAAHCAYNKRYISVRLGEYDRSSQDMTGKEDLYAIAAYTHKDYENKTHMNDIALLRLSRCVSYNDYIQPICIQTDPRRKSYMDDNYKRFTAVGWGRTKKEKSSYVLQAVSLKRLPRSDCRDEFWNIDTSTQICAGSRTGGDTCGGDSGGPLHTSDTSYSGVMRKTQLGIISFGTEHCRGIGEYTNVMSYVEWIKKIVTESDIEVVAPKLDLLDGNCISNSNSQTSTYPWLAHIYIDSFPLALGTLITDRFVISTAQWYFPGLPLKVRLGRNSGAPVATHTVEHVFRHWDFEEFTKNDIALIKLANNVQYTDYIRPICLPFLNNTAPYQKKADQAERLVVIGFSQKSSASVPRINSTNCYNGKYQKLEEKQFCFAHPPSVSMASGSPLVRKFLHGDNQAYTLVGMANFGQSDQRGMDVYTDVLRYANWIDEHISQ